MKLKQKIAIFHALTIAGVFSVICIACDLPMHRGLSFGVSLIITIAMSSVVYFSIMNEGDNDER